MNRFAPLALLPLLGSCAFIPDNRPIPPANPPVFCYETIGRPQCFDRPQVNMGDLINAQLPPIVFVPAPATIVTRVDGGAAYPVTTIGDDASFTTSTAPIAIIGPSDDVPFTDAPLPVPLVPNEPSSAMLPRDYVPSVPAGGAR